MKLIPFNKLAKGTRFRYPDNDDKWIVLECHGRGLICKWYGAEATKTNFCCFTDDTWSLDSEVEVHKGDN